MTRSRRVRLGWFAALAYLVCVLAPAAALAAGDAASCLGDDLPVAVSTHRHAVQHHMHDGGAMHDHAGMHAHHDQMAAQDAPAPHHHDGKGSTGPCCAMMCATALPADLPGIVKPWQPISACAPEIALHVHSEAPPLLYRPPIA